MIRFDCWSCTYIPLIESGDIVSISKSSLLVRHGFPRRCKTFGLLTDGDVEKLLLMLISFDRYANTVSAAVTSKALHNNCEDRRRIRLRSLCLCNRVCTLSHTITHTIKLLVLCSASPTVSFVSLNVRTHKARVMKYQSERSTAPRFD